MFDLTVSGVRQQETEECDSLDLSCLSHGEFPCDDDDPRYLLPSRD